MCVREARRLLIGLLATGALSGCSENSAQAAAAAAATERPPAPLVRVLEVMPEAVAAVVEIAGVVDARVISRITAPVEGVVEALAVREGDAVVKGQILGFISSSEREALLAMTDAQLHALRTRPTGGLSVDEQRELERARAEAVQDRRSAADLVQPMPIVAPVAGRVLEKPAEVGAAVMSRELLMTVGDLTRPVVRTTVSDLLLPRLHPADAVTVRVHALPKVTFSGRLRVVGPQVDPITRTAPVEIEILTGASRLRPGMAATVTVTTDRREQALLVPDDALLLRPDGRRVLFIAVGDSARERAVQVGLSVAARTEIIAGLQGGDLVIVEGQNGLRDGAPVRRQPAPAGTPPQRRGQ